ncbi:MAG: HTH-type transcriptional regulator / antitoxin HigA [Bacteroidales bacterium]|nr:HTH-type transcriptional regulator / antitoxin HigA [Bacteroidales bacterium]
MKTKILKTEQEYNEAIKRINEIIHSSENAIEPDSLEGEELELLSLLVEIYEKEHFSIGAPNPIEAIKFRMEQMNLKQADIAPLFGGKTRVSEVLRGKRPLSLKMITLLHRYLGIPLESLVAGNEKIKLKPEMKQKLLKNPSIIDFLKIS